MPHLDQPLRFEPFPRPLVWGGRKLGSVLGKSLPDDQDYGESWEVSDHPSHRSRLVQGPSPLLGTTLRRLMEDHAAELLGPAAAKHQTFPWLIKFLDACDWLSVQVHPSDENAPRLWPGEGGKTEAWFILDAEPTARIWAGLKPGVGPEQFRAALESGQGMDCLHSFVPRPGQCLFLPAGTVHAVGGGVLLAEVQQTSDATFRLYDWNRKDAQGKSRTLHIEQGLAATDFARGPVDPISVADFPGLDPRRWSGALPAHSKDLVQCPYFSLRYVQGIEAIPLGGRGQLEAFLVLAGQGKFKGGDAIERGQAWVVPASLEKTTLLPQGNGMVILVCSLSHRGENK